jgi:hypothetical protein
VDWPRNIVVWLNDAVWTTGGTLVTEIVSEDQPEEGR